MRLAELEPLMAEAVDLAERYPAHEASQKLAGDLCYRASRWSEAAKYLGRAGLSAELQPDSVFYLAVARFESGDLAGAREVLRPALPRLARSPFVDGYVRKILGP